jgi:hypothetical protein
MDTITTATRYELMRATDGLCLIGAITDVLGGLVTIFIPPAIASNQYTYPNSPTGYTLAALTFILNHMLLLIGVLGVACSGTDGRGGPGRIGLWTSVARAGDADPVRGGLDRAGRPSPAVGRASSPGLAVLLRAHSRNHTGRHVEAVHTGRKHPATQAKAGRQDNHLAFRPRQATALTLGDLEAARPDPPQQPHGKSTNPPPYARIRPDPAI